MTRGPYPWRSRPVGVPKLAAGVEMVLAAAVLAALFTAYWALDLMKDRLR